MKTVVTFALLFLTLSIGYSQSKTTTKKGPQMTFKSMEVDLGAIVVGKTFTHSLPFINDGTEPLVAGKMTSSNEAMVITLADYKVTPGQSSSVEINFMPKTKGAFKEKIYIQTNMSKRPILLLVSGTIK